MVFKGFRASATPAALAVATAVAVTPALALAQTGAASDSGIEEIVVTAQKRSENMQRTPIAITALTEKALQSAGITDLRGVSANTPAVTIAEYPSAASTLATYMRGQGTGDPMIITRDGSVGIYVDGFYQARPQSSAFDLADVDRIEILRGPQGTLYGRNTTGGAVNIISKKPTGKFGIDGTADVGNFGYHREFVNLNLPSFGNLAAKLTFVNSNFDGYVRNMGKEAGTPEANNYTLKESIGGRLALRWTPSNSLTVDYAGDIARTRTTPVYYVNDALVGLIPGYSNDPRRTYRPIYLPKSVAKTDGHSLTVEYQAADNLTLRSLTGYRHLDYTAYSDYAEVFFASFLNGDVIKSKSFSQEFQAVGDLANNNIKYALGLYYFNENADHQVAVDIASNPVYLGGTDDTLILKNRSVRAKSTSYAAYGQVTWKPPILEKRLGITAGGRFTHDRRRASRLAGTVIFTAAPGTTIPALRNRLFLGHGSYLDLGTVFQENDRTWSRFNPAFTVDFQATPDINLYVKYATGYKAGGSTEGAPDFSFSFNPEDTKTYEVGLKSDLFDRHVRLNLAGFISKTRNFQVDFLVSAVDPSLVQILNAGSATVKGIEAELTVQPTSRLSFNAAYSYMKQKLRIGAPADSIFDVSQGGPFNPGDDISGYLTIPFTPKNNLNVSGNWTMLTFPDGDLSLYVSYNYRGQLFGSAGAGPLVPNNAAYARPAYDTVDARLTYRREIGGHDVSVALWGKNIFDKRYLLDFVTANGSPLAGYVNGAKPYASPAQYGVQMGFRF